MLLLEIPQVQTIALVLINLLLHQLIKQLLLQLISYLDRGNIGFAATQGMSKDIHLKGNQLNVSHISTSRRW